MYIQGMAQQTQVFLLCAGFGFLLGAVYDVIRFIRKIFIKSVKSVVFQDILFFSVCTVSAFFFMLCVDDGRLRLYPYMGMLLGFLIWFFTLETPVGLILNRISAFLNSFAAGTFTRIKKFLIKTLKKLKKRKNKPSNPLEKSIRNSV